MGSSYDLTAKTAIVTGGSRGIGRAIVERLMASGASVEVWDISVCEIDMVNTVAVDVVESDQISQALARLLRRVPRVDILINNAGYLGLPHAFCEHDEDDWQKVIQVNLLGAMRVAHAILPHMRRWGGGRIVNMGSLTGKVGLAQSAAYVAANAGVIAFTKALSREAVSNNVFVNCVAVGPVDTNIIRELGAQVVEAIVADSPIEQLGFPGEVAHLVAWLCSDACQFSGGAVFDISGRRTRH